MSIVEGGGYPLELLTRLEPKAGESLKNQGKSRRIVGKLICLTVTRLNISNSKH